jgi:uncharacterized protein YdaU (DUF1376 family)
VNYYPFHIGDYLSATRHLSWEEDAAYRRLLDTYYTTEKPLPNDLRQVCRLVLATTETQREAVQTVLEEFFEATENGWINARADAEIATMREKQQKQRDKANKRWQKPPQEHGIAPAMPQHEVTDATASKTDADAMPPTPTPTPTPTPVLKNTPITPKGVDERFERFWLAYPRKVGKDAAKRAFDKRRPDDALVTEMLKAVAVHTKSESWRRDGGQFIPHPATWLNQGRWQDGDLLSSGNDSTGSAPAAWDGAK